MTETMEHGVALPKLKLGTFISHPKFLDSIDPPKYPFHSPAWTLQEKPRSILLLDVFKNHEMIGTYNVNQKAVYLIGCTYLVDLGSCHGTFVDEVPLQKLQPTLIVNGSILKFGASSRYYCFKTFESREQIVEIVRQSSGLENDEMIVQQNTMLNRAISYRLGISPVRDDAKSNDRAGCEDSRHSQSTSMATTKKSSTDVDPFRDKNGTHRKLSESHGKANVSVKSRRSLSLAQSHSMTSHSGKCQAGSKGKRVHFCTDPPKVISQSDSNFPKRKCASTEDLSSLVIEGD